MLVTDYDLRGILGKDLTYNIIYYAFQRFLQSTQAKKILLATDFNQKSFLIKEFLQVNFPEQVEYLETLPTPIFYFEVIKRKLPGIMITASHLGLKYTGMKFILKDGTVFKPKINNIKKINYQVLKVKKQNLKINRKIYENYFSKLEKFSKLKNNFFVNFNLKNFFLKSALPYFKKLNIYHSEKSDWKIDSDIDNDRLYIFYQKRKIHLDLVFYFLSLEEKYKNLGVPIYFSEQLKKLLIERNKKIFYIPTGHNNFKNSFRKYNLDLAFEPSGHFYFFKDLKTESPYLALIKFLNFIENKRNFEKFLFLLREIRIKRFDLKIKKYFDLEKLVSNLKKRFYFRTKNFDGFLLYNKKIKLHLRKSKTENKLRVTFEWLNKKN